MADAFQLSKSCVPDAVGSVELLALLVVSRNAKSVISFFDIGTWTSP